MTEGGEPRRLVVSTALIRRTCDDGWTVALGGRGEMPKTVFANDTGTLTFGRACIDMGLTVQSGHATDARLLINRCSIQLSPLRFRVDGAIETSVTATVDPSTVEGCSTLLPQSAGALSGTLANAARIAFTTRYELEGRSLGSVLSSQTNESTAGFARRIVSTMRTSHALDVSLRGGNASLRLDTEPAGDSAAATLSVQANAAMAAHVSDVWPPAGSPLKLEVRWNLDHQTGTVRVNGEEIKRVPLAASREAGRVDLPAAECNAPGRSLVFVEADDKGEPLRPAQIDGVFTAVDGSVAGAGALVVVFVHGWHHSAAPGDAYVCRFSDVLASVEPDQGFAPARNFAAVAHSAITVK